MFGSPETTTGGNALKYYASVRIDIRKIGQIKNGDDTIGNRTRVKIVKNKVAPPFKQVEFDILYGKGISKVGEIIDLGVELGVIKKSGANFYYNQTKLALGREKLVKMLEDNPDLADEIEKKIRELIAAGATIKEMSKEEKAEAEKEENEEITETEE
jgi:recombination protein RecA